MPAPPPTHDTKRWLWAMLDAPIWVIAVCVALLLRFDFDASMAFTTQTVLLALSAAAINLLVGALVGPYAVGHLRGSYEEIIDIAKMVGVTTVLLLTARLLGVAGHTPRSVPLVSGLAAVLGMFAIRFVYRSFMKTGKRVADARRVIVFGAGEGGRQLVRALNRDTSTDLTPVAILDDDPRKKRLRIDGVPVQGDRLRIPEIAERTGASVLAIAMPSADGENIRDLHQRATHAGLDVLVLPPAGEMMSAAGVSDLRSIDLADLLGRQPVELDGAAISEVLSGRTVLVTGAGGSIGSELCRQIARFGPGKLLMLDRDESGLASTQMAIYGKQLLDSDDVILADIRDPEALHAVFAQHRPSIVFHAAALKHLPMLEQYPLEAWKTNVLGTLNVLEAAHRVGVSTFVNISTDKAADPSCVLGYSKRVTERLTAAYAAKDQGTYVSVRFGNVLGSRGSVLTAFTAQIERGGPVTVTHPDVERYFMLIPEACQLVLQAAAIGKDGEVMVLNMGDPVKIKEVAQTLIELSGRRSIDIVYTGLRPGEKMSEDLFSDLEAAHPSAHPLVSHVGVPAIPGESVRAQHHPDHMAAAEWMMRQARMVAPPGGAYAAPRPDGRSVPTDVPA